MYNDHIHEMSLNRQMYNPQQSYTYGESKYTNIQSSKMSPIYTSLQRDTISERYKTCCILLLGE